jgi:DNA-binding transcriptional regulator GbsR (MarR family)
MIKSQKISVSKIKTSFTDLLVELFKERGGTDTFGYLYAYLITSMKNEFTQKELASELNISVSTISRLLKVFEESNLLSKEPLHENLPFSKEFKYVKKSESYIDIYLQNFKIIIRRIKTIVTKLELLIKEQANISSEEKEQEENKFLFIRIQEVHLVFKTILEEYIDAEIRIQNKIQTKKIFEN